MTTYITSGETGMKSGRTVTLTVEDMQKKKNDVKAITTLLLSLPDEHQLRFKGLETLEHTFNRLQVIVGQLQFIDIEIEQDDLNQKFLTSLAPEWLMHTIVWRNRNDLDTMSLDNLYNHLKSYMANDEEDNALVADEVAPIEFAFMANTNAESKKLETLKEEKEGVDRKLTGLLKASKDLDNLIESQRPDKNKDGLGYSAVPPPPAQLYLSLMKDLS
nr:hypothetical protein [Tanacetum cinerariifolium]